MAADFVSWTGEHPKIKVNGWIFLEHKCNQTMAVHWSQETIPSVHSFSTFENFITHTIDCCMSISLLLLLVFFVSYSTLIAINFDKFHQLYTWKCTQSLNEHSWPLVFVVAIANCCEIKILIHSLPLTHLECCQIYW